MNILGAQTQVGGAVFASLVRATWPASVKFVSCMPLPLITEWRQHRPDGLLVYRKWYPDGDGSAAEAERRSRETIDEARPLLRTGPVFLEAPWNEERANGDGLDSLAAQTTVFVDRAVNAGFVPVVFVLPEGNPANKPDLRRPAVIAAVRHTVERCGFVVIGAHGYSAPPLQPDDPWHFPMWTFWLAAINAEAPELWNGVRFYVGELGLDGGVQTGHGPNRPETGYRGYDLTHAQYARDWLRVQHARMLTDPHVLGGAVFGSEMLPPWNSDHGFDVRDEVDVRVAFTEQLTGPTRLPWSWPPASPEVPTVPDWYPPAARRPIGVNYTAGRAGRTVALIVHHIADGLGSPWQWFNTDRGDDGSSAHFWVSKTGTIEQYRPLSDTCWANGPVCQPDTSNPVIVRVTGAGQVNAQTVAVEHEGHPGDPMPAAQLLASRALTSWLAARYALPLDRTHLVGHYQIDRCTRANCPGPSHPWNALLTGGTPVPTPDPAQLETQVWALGDQLMKLGDQYLAAGYPHRAEFCRSQGNAVKEWVNTASKGQH